MTISSNLVAKKEKRQAALSSVIAAILLTGLKLVIGLITGSLGILAEAAHSGLDLIAAIVTFFAVRLSDRPPDDQHLYGHGKVENLSALFETFLLLVTCVWIINESIERLFLKSVEIQASIWAFAVMIISILVDISRSKMLYQAARKHNSQALEADALHFSTDIWSSAVVIVGLAFVWFGTRLGAEWNWLTKADAIAALGVAIIVIYVSIQLGRRTIAVLLDAAPPGLAKQIIDEAIKVPGVESVGTVRLRQSGASIFVDMTVNVPRSDSLEEGHRIASIVDERVSRLIKQGDVIVHVDPVRSSDENLIQTVSSLAARLGVPAHDIHSHEENGKQFVDLHIEVPSNLTLSQAHDKANELESLVQKELPQVNEVHCHIEPLAPPVATTRAPLSPEEENFLRAQIRVVVNNVPGLRECHGLHIQTSLNGHDIILDCVADPDLPVAQAHQLASEVEHRLKDNVPGIAQVLVHVEPEGSH